MTIDSVGSFRRACERAGVLYCYGAGYVGKMVASIMDVWKIDLAGYVVTNLDNSISKVKNMPLHTIDNVKCSADAIFIVAVTKKYQQEIIEKLQEKNCRYICIAPEWIEWIRNKLELEKLKCEFRVNQEFESRYHSEINKHNEVLHIIVNDKKFTTGYINFMKVKMLEYKHIFAVIGNCKDVDNLVDKDNIIYLECYADLRRNEKIRRLINEVSKIIMSGIWSGDLGVYSQSILDKVYLHFWGGDFYDLRYREWDRKHKSRIQRMLKRRLLSRCHANIFLMASELEAYQAITGIDKICYVAPMPEDPLKSCALKFRKAIEMLPKPRVVVGNSATKENHHVEIFEMLVKWKSQIEVICPLSYGDLNYRDIVIRTGKNLLGDSFKPIVDFMNMQDYIDMLATCKVGIYYNDRQQALGNIYINFRLGNKIYLRKGTSMWKEFFNWGIRVCDAEDIRSETLLQFLDYPKVTSVSNEKIAYNVFSIENAKKKWGVVLNSV